MLLVSCNGASRVQVQTRGPATAKLLLSNWVLVRGMTHNVRASADHRHHVDRLQPPTDSHWRGTARMQDRVEPCSWTREWPA